MGNPRNIKDRMKWDTVCLLVSSSAECVEEEPRPDKRHGERHGERRADKQQENCYKKQ